MTEYIFSYKDKLSQRIGMHDIQEILRQTHDDDSRKQELYRLVLDEDETIGYHAAWIFTHFSSEDNKWLYNRQNELIDELFACKHGGKRRVLLNLLYRQPYPNPPRVDFLDYCLNRMLSSTELPAIQCLSMKIAYELCLPIPELVQELKTALGMMEANLPPSIRAVRRNILKAMEKGKSLQKL